MGNGILRWSPTIAGWYTGPPSNNLVIENSSNFSTIEKNDQ